MKSDQFWPGDRVLILNNDEGVKPGQVGIIKSKWRDALYSVRTKDGSFHFLDGTEVSSILPDHHEIKVGDTIRVTTSKHDHPYAREGDLFRVLKVIEDMESYVVLVNGEYYSFANFELAHFM